MCLVYSYTFSGGYKAVTLELMELQKHMFALRFSVKLVLVGRQYWLVTQMEGNLQSSTK